ncbi:MAG: amidohydrolase family protein [Anaerolineae bacterium]
MIDFHTHPLLIREMVEKHPELVRAARDIFFIGNNFQPLETFLLELDVSGLERVVLLPIDCTTARGAPVYTNEQIAEVCQMSGRFVGFASVDPHQPDAPARLREAVERLGLRGLKLAPSLQEFFPNDRGRAYPIYEMAQKLQIPVVVHAGMTWEPGVRLGYSQPMLLEDVAADFPDLRLVIAHVGWPWVLESVTLALKYPNVYLDTSCLYFDNPHDFVRHVFTRQIALTWVERTLRHQIVFGSNYPRVEIKNMVAAVRGLGLSEGCLRLIFSENARVLLGEVIR